MLLLSAVALASLGCPDRAAAALCPPKREPPPVEVTVDSSRHEVTLTTGPWSLPNMPPMEDHAMMEGAAGSETDDASVPKTIGVPLSRGMDLGFYIMWHNESGEDLDGVYLKYTMLWTPTNQNPRPVTSLPLYMDVNLTVGGSNTFDVPPGRSEKAYEFTLPVGGRLLGVGGHMHDYGSLVKLMDVESGKELTRVTAKRDSSGKVLGISRKLFGVTGDGLKLKANHRYKVVGVYDNPTGQLRPNGAMAHMVGLFVPDDMSQWPVVDKADPTMRRDLASLQVPGYEDAAAPPAAAGNDHHGNHGGRGEHEGHSQPPR